MDKKSYDYVFNPCDGCVHGVNRRDGNGEDTMCKMCEITNLGKENDSLRAELAKVTAERDAAKADIREILIHEFVCEYCKHYNMIGCAPKCKELAEWRGVQAMEAEEAQKEV